MQYCTTVTYSTILTIWFLQSLLIRNFFLFMVKNVCYIKYCKTRVINSLINIQHLWKTNFAVLPSYCDRTNCHMEKIISVERYVKNNK